MPSYSMNIGEQGVEQNRECDDRGFAIDDRGVSPSTTAYHSLGADRGDLPGEIPSPLQNEVVHTNDTMKPPLGPTAHDLVVGRQ